jgi:hypothetical protein
MDRRRRVATHGVPALLVGVALVAGAWLAVLPGCQKADPQAALKDRVSTYWGLKQAKTWPDVYDKYLDPEAKKSVAKDAFLKRRWLAFDILSYEIGEVQLSGDKAKVSVTNEVNFPLKTPQGDLTFIKKQVTTQDDWVQRDGTWYVVLTE